MSLFRSVPQAGAVVFRMNGRHPEILIVAAKKSPGEWVFPKGHLKPDESLESATLRETEEEAGVTGRIIAAICPPLEFQSGDERVKVQYYVVVRTGDVARREDRQQQWLTPNAALKTLTHESARELLRRALPDIHAEVALVNATADRGIDTGGYRELALREYDHTADSLLRNEEEGEKRVTFFITIVGAVAAALAFLVGATRIRPDTREPLVILSLVPVLLLGYLTFARVVQRNMASDRYKRALNRSRRQFLSGPDDPHVAFVAFNPFRVESRPLPSWRSIGRGGWMETTALVESLVMGAWAAAFVNTADWWRDGAVAAVVTGATWVLLIRDARRRQDRRRVWPC